MIIYDLHFISVSVAPDETDAPLVIHSNAVPALPAALQGLQTVAGRHSHIFQARGAVQHDQLSEGEPQYLRPKPLGPLAPEERFRLAACEGSYHTSIVGNRRPIVNTQKYRLSTMPLPPGVQSGKVCESSSTHTGRLAHGVFAVSCRVRGFRVQPADGSHTLRH